MSARNWTEEQRKVIELKNRNILVSAAAGSGKTAVLVERIVNMICDEKRPVDIDRLLVVTFTNAAAGEMRERVGQAVEERLSGEPENRNLQKQISLLHSAQIMTIHSFCLDLIKNHFNAIDLDPAFRLAEEAELMLLRSDVLSEVLENAYAEGEPAFLKFAETYAPGKSDLPVENLVLRLFSFSMGYPWPREWLRSVTADFLPESEDGLLSEKFMKKMMEHITKLTEDAVYLNSLACQLSEEGDGPYMYLDCLNRDREGLLTLLSACKNYREYEKALSVFSFGRLPGKKDETVDVGKREKVKSLRNVSKDCVEDIRKSYFSRSLTEVYEELKAVSPHMKALVKLTEQFMDAFSAEKEERNLLDFDDLEHNALKILVKDGTPTAVAAELREHYQEILIDEYQDSNQVQETLLQVISREDMGDPNRFMVGDVKQSIYKFRLARPELFMEKYASYRKEDGKYQRIDLHKNFRSRPVVLASANYLFEGIMHASLGNVEYDQDAALSPGAQFPENDKALGPVSETTDVLLIHDENKLLEDTGSKELEAEAVAWKIRKLMEENFRVLDEGVYRPARYGDMVILLRTMSGYADLFVEALEKRGIPAFADTTTGYFSAVEVVKILNFLLIIDNPVQDIPFTAVLHSPIGGMANGDLAKIRIAFPDQTVYESVWSYASEGTEPELAEKCRRFLNLLNELRDRVPYTSVYDLLTEIYERTGYYDYVTVLPGGNVRKGNLDMLLSKAADFEKTSYRGLFHFNRYIEKLHQYEIDFGEAGAASDVRDAVRIMSIHKSKGLEFPIVFLSGMMKRFNQSDSRASLLLHPDLGIGPDLVNVEWRTKRATLKKKIIQKCIAEESLGEELRVLYVAMTRAKEKLILTGVVGEVSKQMEKWELRKTLTYRELLGAGCYFDWIMPRILSAGAEACFRLETVSAEDITLGELKKEIEKKDACQTLEYWEENFEDAEKSKELQERLSFSYPFADLQKIKSKMSVSELKRMGQEEEGAEELFQQPEETEAYIPSFAREEEEVTGAGRGTVYHKVLEQMDFSAAQDNPSICAELARLLQEQRILPKEREAVRIGDLLKFLKSPLGERISKAQKEGRLHRESPFVLGKAASELYGEAAADETVLIQGIIDVYFEEGEGIILMDYKTDRISDENELRERYRMQLAYYQEALERNLGTPVTEKWIYSFYLGKAIPV